MKKPVYWHAYEIFIDLDVMCQLKLPSVLDGYQRIERHLL